MTFFNRDKNWISWPLLKKLRFIVYDRKGNVSGGAPSLQNWWREAAASLWVRLLTLSPLFR